MDTPIINGTAYPAMTVERKAYRFRVLNAANDRTFSLQLYYADALILGPAERADIIIDFSKVPDGSSLPAVAALPALKHKPDTVFVSSGYPGESMWKLDAAVLNFTYIAYPYRMPADEERFTGIVELFLGTGEVGRSPNW